jgi:hypothetical protein
LEESDKQFWIEQKQGERGFWVDGHSTREEHLIGLENEGMGNGDPSPLQLWICDECFCSALFLLTAPPPPCLSHFWARENKGRLLALTFVAAMDEFGHLGMSQVDGRHKGNVDRWEEATIYN